MTTELEAFRSVNFVWTRQLKSIWHDQQYHVPSIHQGVLDDLAEYFLANTREQEPDNEPLGRIIVGPAGLGKTHLIGELRRKVWESHGAFILLDLVGVKDFWSSIALGYLNSLQIRLPDGRTMVDLFVAARPDLSEDERRIVLGWRDVVETICKSMEVKFVDATTVVEERPGQDAAYIIDSTRARTDLGWSPQISLQEGLTEVSRWVKENWVEITRQSLEYQHKP